MTEAKDDEVDEELETIQAIYPELHIHGGEPRRASLEIEVAPSNKLVAVFEPPILPPTYTLPGGAWAEVEQTRATPQEGEPTPAPETHELEFLPSLQLELTLPEAYPDDAPPKVALSTDPSWLPEHTLRSLETEVFSLWTEYGHSQILFAYIDQLSTQASSAFDLPSPVLLPYNLKTPLLNFSYDRAHAKFAASTFDCGVCLEPKKGSSCHRLSTCGHVFCIGCLQDFFNSAITEGDVGSVKCLDPSCGAPFPNAQPDEKRKKPRTLHPRELLQIPLERQQVQRFVDLKLKKKLDADKTTVFCPRKHCQAPARSPKYAKYLSVSLEDYPDSDDEDFAALPPPDPNAEAPLLAIYRPPGTSTDRLRICSRPTCTYAFCRTCLRSWHGEHIHCRPPASLDPGSMNPEEAASHDWIRMHTSPCPTCESPTVKTMGCNHMICGTCSTHFCYLCSAWLHAGNPYSHFNTRTSGCYMRLWELEEGDEGADPGFAALDVPIGGANGQNQNPFGGIRAAEQAAIFAAMLNEPAPRDAQAQLQPQLQPQAQPRPQANANANAPARQQQDNLANQIAQIQLQDIANANPERPAGGRQPHRAQLPPAQRAAQQRRVNGGGGQAAARQPAAPAPAAPPRGGGGRGARGMRAQGRAGAQAQAQAGVQAQVQAHPPAHPLARVEPDPGLQRFLELAARDEEDGWDSDEMEGWG